MNALRTTHNLDFLSKPWERDPEWQVFKIGTCHGQWKATKDAYEILTVINDRPGNGHFNDVLEWFEFASKRDGRALRIREVWNRRLFKHLQHKRGFTHEVGDDVIKHFVK